MRGMLFLSVLALVACSSPGGPYPSLQPRAAESIDPRVPIERPMNDRPVSPAMAARLAELVNQARAGDSAFDPLASEAERLASAAGAAPSDSWIAAQQALSAAIEARRPTANALADIDALGAAALQTNRGIAPNDLAAIQQAAAEVAALDQRQADRVGAMQQGLGL